MRQAGAEIEVTLFYIMLMKNKKEIYMFAFFMFNTKFYINPFVCFYVYNNVEKKFNFY